MAAPPTPHSSALPPRAAALLARATRHPFLDAVRAGTLAVEAFDTWLAQDALFVADLLRFQARLLARAPRPAQAVLAGGLVALVDELAWFEQLAARRGLALDVAPLPETASYAALLDELDQAPYAEAVRCLWVLEQVYLDAWTSARGGAEVFRELVDHWTTPGFTSYVAALQEHAADGRDDALLERVLLQEVAFWDMALAPSTAAQTSS